MIKCKNKIWIENFSDLFCSTKILPIGCETLENKLNSITRFVILIFILLLLIDLKISLIFLIVSLTIIIIYYYISKNKKMSKENFISNQQLNKNKNTSNIMFSAGPNGYANTYRAKEQINPSNNHIEVLFDRPTSYRFCNDETKFNFNSTDENGVETFMYNNQKLAGQCNPKTLIPPVIVPPSADLSYWKANNLVTHSHVNDMRQIDNYRSGYQITTCCGDTSNMYISNDGTDGDVLIRPPKNCNKINYKKNNYESNKVFQENNIKENFSIINDNINDTINDNIHIKPYQSGQLNMACGYNPSQLFEAGLPTNYPSGNCEKDPIFKNYNENLFTQTIQPGVYTYNQVNEPINSNIGISFTQQFEPVTCKKTDNGNVLYTEHDPRIFDDNIIEPIEETVNESNVYDPRFSGYGTSYRSYTDNNLGQTKFYYDDINAIRMPNYIARSDVDFLPFADTYGPMISSDGNQNNSIIRGLVDDAWTRNSLEFRTGLQQSLMRKRNSEAWQQRQAPIYKNNQRMLTG